MLWVLEKEENLFFGTKSLALVSRGLVDYRKGKRIKGSKNYLFQSFWHYRLEIYHSVEYVKSWELISHAEKWQWPQIFSKVRPLSGPFSRDINLKMYMESR